MKLAVLPGDGIGPEITSAALQVIEHVKRACSLDLTIDVHEIGLAALQRTGTTLPASVLDACRHADGFGDLPNVLANAGACDLVEGLTVATVLAEAGIVRLRAVPAGRACGRRTSWRCRHSAPATLLCEQRTAGKQRSDTQREHFAHVQTSEIVQASVYNWIRRMPQVRLKPKCTDETGRRQVPY
jgi:hypothetical protein